MVVLGVSYLENADGARNTPAAALTKLLLGHGAQVVAHDPYVRAPDWQRALGDGCNVPLTADLDQALTGADCSAIVTKHRPYFELSYEKLCAVMRTPMVVDGRNVLDYSSLTNSPSLKGIVVRTVGKE